MKKLILKTSKYKLYEKRFKLWLGIMGMNKSSQYYMPLHVREMLHYMEARSITSVEEINPEQIRNYFQYLSLRKNERRGGGLSKATMNKHLQAIKKFSEYIWKTNKIMLHVSLQTQVTDDKKKIEVLSQAEIRSLYEAAEEDKTLELRDKALLDIYYSCGLRRTEGIMLDVSDVDLDLRRLHVRYGKNYTQRYVPFTRSTAERLRIYIHESRAGLLANQTEQALLISLKGNRLSGESAIKRLQKLQERSKAGSIKLKEIGLHTLRHSIATHLLHGGLALKQISNFLGHKSIESTQIYTKLIHEL